MEFSEYLTGKKISIEKFKKGDPALFQEWESHFSVMHPASFTSQKLFLINKLRRSYLLEEKAPEGATGGETEKLAPPKSKMIPKFKR